MGIKLDNAKIDVKDWQVFDVDEEKKILSILNKSAEKFVNIILQNNVSVCFPKEFGSDDGFDGGPVDDPLTIYIVLDEDEVVLKKLSLTEALEETIEICEEDGSFSTGLAEISKKMKELSSRIDAAIESHK